METTLLWRAWSAVENVGRFEIFLSEPMKSSFVIAEKVGREVCREVGVINNFPLDSYVSVHET